MRVIFSLIVGFVFLAIGTVLGGVFFVPADSGLAAAPIALSYGLAAAMVAALLAFVGYSRIPSAHRKWLWFPVMAATFLIAAIFVRSYTSTQLDQQAYLDELRRNFPPFELSWLSARESGKEFTSLEVESRNHSFRIAYLDGRSCTGSIGNTSTEKGELLSALRNIEGEVFRDPQLCVASDESPVNRFSYTIHEAMPPPNIGNMELTSQCLASNPVLSAALDSIERVYRRLRRVQSCQ